MKVLSLADLNDEKKVADFIGSPVELRGFVYKDSKGRIFLASESGLKSCCVGKKGLKLSLKDLPVTKILWLYKGFWTRVA